MEKLSLFTNSPQMTYAAFQAERIRAHAKHDSNGGSMERKEWTHPVWLPVLGEEFGEVARVICEFELGNITHEQYREKLEEELIQVGAMTAAWIDSINRA